MKKGLEALARRGDLAINNYGLGGVLKDGTVVNSNGKPVYTAEGKPMAELTKDQRSARDARELSNWEQRRMQGETRQREDRRVEAAKAKEDGVEQRQPGQRQGGATVILRA